MPTYKYLFKYNNQGYSQNPETDLTFTEISNNLSTNINNTLVESGQNKIIYTHPDWIKKSDIKTIDACDIELVFISEGAGYKNGLGYYVYDLSNPPTSFSEVNNINVVFPNCSLQGSGGSMKKGDTIKIPYEILTTEKINGKDYMTSSNYIFPKDKGVGFVCFANCWKNGYLKTNTSMFSSDPNFNPETTLLKRNHFVNFISDIDTSKIIYGVEDINRDKSNCDHDFNDMIYTLNISPITSIDLSSFNSTSFQKFTGTILCEDLLNNSNQDHDYNDLIVNYEVVEELQDDKIYSISAKVYTLSRGATRDHNFGIIIPNIKTFTDCRIYRESCIKKDNVIFFKNLTTQIIGQGSDRVPIIESTKELFSDLKWATNTLNENINSIVEPSISTIRIVFPNGKTRNEIGGRYFPYNFYLKSFRTGYENKGYYLYSDIFYSDVSNELKNANITEKKKLIILEGVDNFRIPFEKKGLRKVYPKFKNYLMGQKKFLGTWYSDKYSKDKLLYPRFSYDEYFIMNKAINYKNKISDSNNNLYIIPTNVSINNYLDWGENNLTAVLNEHNLSTVNLLSWSFLQSATVQQLNSIIYFIKTFGNLNILFNGNYKDDVNKNYYISIKSLQQIENKNAISSIQGSAEVIELLSEDSINEYIIVKNFS